MTARSPVVMALALFATCIVPHPARADDSEDNLTRIKAMSRVDRTRMSKALEAFDALDRPLREEIRELDDRLSNIEPKSRARYLEIMRRYHVFYQTLPKDKRAALDREADSTKKLELIATYRAEQKNQPAPARILADDLQVSTLSPLRLRVTARHLIVFFSLDPVKDVKERAEFARLKNAPDRETLHLKLMAKMDPADRRALREKLREEDEEFLAAEETIRKDPALAKRLLQGQSEAAKANPQSKKSDEFVTKQRAQLIRVLDEEQVLRDLDNENVTQANLDRFEAALPPWARESLDALPPTAARRRLKALYRLVYPTPEEMPTSKSAAPPQEVKPVAPRAGGTNPF